MPVIGDKVKLKPDQESAYRPQSLLDYLTDTGLSEADAVFTVVDVFQGRRDTMVDFEELDTRGGYYARRFEVVPSADATAEPVTDATPEPVAVAEPSLDLSPILVYTQQQVDALVGQARKAAIDEVLAAIKALQV